MRRAVALVAALSLGGLAPATVAEGAEKGPSAAEMNRVQRKANEAAARLGRAETSVAQAEDEIGDLEARAALAGTRVSSLEGQVRQMALRQYLRGGAPESWVGEGDLTTRVRGQALLRSVTQQQADAIDAYRANRDELEETREALGEQLAARRKAVSALRSERAKVSAELARLAAAQRAFEARLAAEKAAAEKAAAEKARATRAAAARPARSAAGPVVKAAAAKEARVIGSGEWVCPVQGARAFSNDWGQPRSGGRRHQGNDIFAARGTPVVASVAGSVKGHSSSRGGISYYLVGEDGNTYFGTHLDRLSGAAGRVAAGTVVGYVGSSGNASASSPHLHFEIHPGGGGPVNPYPTVARNC